MKTNHARGGRFVANWRGEAPKGRDSSPLYRQKGQQDEDRRLRFTVDRDGSRIWSF